jgi:hypothetical protein
LKVLQAVRTTSLLVQQCQKALSDISTQLAVGLYWVPGHEIAEELARGGSAGPEPALGVSRQDIRRMSRCCLVNQPWVWWGGLGDTQNRLDN